MLSQATKKAVAQAVLGRAFFSTAKIPLYINGKFVESKTDKWIPVHNPATGEVISQCPQATPAELKAATDAAAAAFPAWRNTPVTARQRHMFELQALIRKNEKELIDAVVAENGKVIADAKVRDADPCMCMYLSPNVRVPFVTFLRS